MIIFYVLQILKCLDYFDEIRYFVNIDPWPFTLIEG